MSQKHVSCFIISAGGLLLAAGLVRFLIVASNAQVLSVPEPLLGIPLRYGVLIAGALELAIAYCCLFGRNTALQIGLLAWFSTNFAVYQAALLFEHIMPQGACWGALTDPLHLNRGVIGILTAITPYYLFLGSCLAGIWHWRTGGLTSSSERTTMFCPSCGGKINFAIQDLGRKIPCPLCKTAIQLRLPESLKMACSFCKENIEFPSHALGRKIPCPHCGMTVILKDSA